MFIYWALTHPLDSQEIPRGTLSESLHIYYIHNSKKRGFPSWQNHNRFETMKWKRKGCYLEMRKKNTVNSRESENIWQQRLYIFTRTHSTQWSRAHLILEHLNSVCLKMWQWMNRSWNWDRLTYGYCKYLEMIFSSKNSESLDRGIWHLWYPVVSISGWRSIANEEARDSVRFLLPRRT